MSAIDHLIARSLPFVPRPIVRAVSRRYIAGETLEDAVRVLRSLNGRGFMATLDVLGEEVRSRPPAAEAVAEYRRALQAIGAQRLDANISVKLTQLGLKLDTAFCMDNTRVLAQEARDAGNFVRIDMEDSSCTDATLELYRALRLEGFDNTGVVLQACLRRSLADARALPEGANVRLCKGIYLEPRTLAWGEREIVRRNFVRLLEEMLDRGFYVGIATHDELLVWEAFRVLETRRVVRGACEFQMLLGVDEELRGLIRASGHRLRVYVPYGSRWYAYSLRRLKENPRIARYVLRGFLGRRG
ncbi:MAG: proline dehydrogenase family protein [Candidatus Polarisedimenticolia bacterium]